MYNRSIQRYWMHVPRLLKSESRIGISAVERYTVEYKKGSSLERLRAMGKEDIVSITMLVMPFRWVFAASDIAARMSGEIRLENEGTRDRTRRRGATIFGTPGSSILTAISGIHVSPRGILPLWLFRELCTVECWPMPGNAQSIFHTWFLDDCQRNTFRIYPAGVLQKPSRTFASSFARYIR